MYGEGEGEAPRDLCISVIIIITASSIIITITIIHYIIDTALLLLLIIITIEVPWRRGRSGRSTRVFSDLAPHIMICDI